MALDTLGETLKPLWNHQVKAIQMAERMPDLFLAMDTGVGKTRTTIEIMRRRFSETRRVMNTLILCPPVVIDNWRREILEFSRMGKTDIVCLTGSGVSRLRRFHDSVFDPLTHSYTKNKIIVTNYEAVQMEGLFEAIQGWGVEILVCDESHKLKDHKSKRAKKVVQIADTAKHRYLLTGTPILNSAMDLFMQFRILDGYLELSSEIGKQSTFRHNYWTFRHKYFEDENARWASRPGHFAKWVPKVETYQELNRKVFAKAIRVLKKDCLDLPPMIRETRFVALGPEQARLYKEMRDDYVTYITSLENSGQPMAIVAQLAITKALRLQQIISGFAKDESGQIHVVEKNPRMDALRDLLEDLCPQHKVIVWCVFKENYRQIEELCKELKLGYALLNGDYAKERTEMIDKFRMEPETPVMIANQQAGGVGVNLTEASYSIFFSRNFSMGDDLQAEARNYRGGSEMHEKITRIDLIAKDTIDELIAEALANKQNIAQVVLDWKRKL